MNPKVLPITGNKNKTNKPTKNVSCPTKFSEYLLNGLPLILSKNIGDCSEIVEKNNFGISVENNIDEILMGYREKIIPNTGDRKRIAEFAKTNLFRNVPFFSG